MIIVPVSSQDPSPNRRSNDSFSPSLPPRQRDSPTHMSELRRQVAGAMLSVMPSSRPAAPNRPKLSLQTSALSSPAIQRSAAVTSPSETESTPIRKAHANLFDAPPPTPTSAVQPQVRFPASSATSSALQAVSHFHNDAPYILPIGTHSILRNSPLPRRHMSTTSRRMFQTTKRVAFQERLVEFMPIQVIEGFSDTELENPSSEIDHQRRREVIEAEDSHSTSIHGRRKRRQWVWRPMEDDVLTSHGLVSVGTSTETPTVPVQADVVKLLSDSVDRGHEIVTRQSSTPKQIFTT